MSPLTKIPTTVTESFISEYPNFLNKNECNMFIDAFQFYKKTGYVTQAGFRSKDGDVRVDPNLRSETNYVFVSDFMFHAVNHSPGHIVTNFFTKLGPVIDDYMDQFGAAIPNLQIQSQDACLKLIEKGIEKTGVKNVVFSGGYGLNCVANYHYLKHLKDINYYEFLH